MKNDTLLRASPFESTVLMGDFNAHTGTDTETWKGVIGSGVEAEDAGYAAACRSKFLGKFGQNFGKICVNLDKLGKICEKLVKFGQNFGLGKNQNLASSKTFDLLRLW